MADRGVVVAARYAGTVDVLVALLLQGGHRSVQAAAEDRDGVEAIERVLCAAITSRACVVTVLSPSDGTAARLQALTGDDPPPVVAVSWHPDDERPKLLRPEAVIVTAGQIRQNLAAAVTTAHRAAALRRAP